AAVSGVGLSVDGQAEREGVTMRMNLLTVAAAWLCLEGSLGAAQEPKERLSVDAREEVLCLAITPDSFYPCGKDAAEFLTKLIRDETVTFYAFGDGGDSATPENVPTNGSSTGPTRPGKRGWPSTAPTARTST